MMMSDADYFPKGTEVEVSIEEEGFRGSWYAATVVKPPPKPSSIGTTRSISISNRNSVEAKVTVEFKDLLESERTQKRLREELDVIHIRPLPPRGRREVFQLNDSVDAFYNDGWWEGVIVKDLGRGRFYVFFRGSKELLEFGEKELRIHREWVHGNWVPPVVEEAKDEASLASDKSSKDSVACKRPRKGVAACSKTSDTIITPGQSSKSVEVSDKTSNTVEVSDKPSKTAVANGKTSKSVVGRGQLALKNKFVKGVAIEVKSDEEGFQGAWFAATILKVLPKDRFLIRYKELKADDGKELCKEEVDILHIRPIPPEIVKPDSYSKHEEVDALHNDGWWVGVISKVYADSRYSVFFRANNEELKFKHSDLRVHQEWIDGKWTVPFQSLNP